MEIRIKDQTKRFDKFLRGLLKPYKDISLSYIFSAIRKGLVKVNGRKQSVDYMLAIGDIVTIIDEKLIGYLSGKPKSETIKKVDLSPITKNIVFENNDYLFLNKPSGIVVHSGNGHFYDHNLTDLLHEYTKKYRVEGFKPQFAYRLDKDTSGMIIAGKNLPALQHLSGLIQSREVDKTYLTVVAGHLSEITKIDFPIFVGYNKTTGKGQSFINARGDEALSIAKPLAHLDTTIGKLSVVEVKIKTGRMHQIRVHMAAIGHPVVGDITYGNESINRLAAREGIRRQLLHSYSYEFLDRNGNLLSYTTPYPKFIEDIRHGITKKDVGINLKGWETH